MRLLLTLVGFAAFTSLSAADELRWFTDLKEARRVARSEGKDLLLNFTDRKRCVPCAQLESQILSKAEFVPAGNLFVLVDLDQSQLDELPEAKRRIAQQWRDEYGIEYVPTIILADATGLPYAKTGYEDLIPEEYVQHLAKLRQARIARDAVLAKLQSFAGPGRGAMIEAVLSTLEGPLSQGPELRTDPLVLFYERLIHEAIAADADNSLGLKEKYESRIAAADEMSLVCEFYDELGRVSASAGHDAAVALLDEKIRIEPRPDLRRRYSLSRVVYLERGDRHDAALATAREIAADESFDLSTRRRMRERIGWNLFRLNRWEEGRDAFRQLVEDVGDDRDAAYRAMYFMATCVAGNGPEAMAEQAFQAAESLADEGSPDWWEAQIVHARMMGSRYGRHRESAERQNRLLAKHDPDATLRAVLLVDLQYSYLGLGRPDLAEGVLGEARGAIDAIRGQDRNGDDEWLEKRMGNVQIALERHRPPSPSLPSPVGSFK